MKKIDKRLDASIRLARVLRERAASLTLPYHERCKSRLAARLDDGEEVALLLPRGTVLADGDMLLADDGTLVRVVAAPEAVLRVHAEGADAALRLMRAAYHLGNRHTPVELGDGYLKLEADPVLRQMLERLGVAVEACDAPFQPEAGAYGGGHRHGHDESFAEDYALAQQVYAEHEPAAHKHGHDHGHDHGHAHGHTHHHGHDHGHD
jgi:urease accessory protein